MYYIVYELTLYTACIYNSFFGLCFNFLNASFDRFGLGLIGNPQLCTIELAKRTFESERYGLAYLIDFLEIETATHHRAFSDAVCAAKVMPPPCPPASL